MKVDGKATEISVTQTALANATGFSRGRISQLAKEGIVVLDPDCDDGAVLLFQSTKNLYTRNKDSEKEEEIDFQLHHARLEKLKADKAEIELAKMCGELYDAKVVERACAERVVVFRNQLSGIAAKIASRVPDEHKVLVSEVVNQCIEEALLELSSLSSADFRGEEDGDT